MVTASCGASNSFNPNNVTVSVSPTTATIAANGTATLQATVQGLPYASSITRWSVAENPIGAICATFVGIVPSGPCPAGTIEIADGNELTVTYFAPSAPGTYHVHAEWDHFTYFMGPPDTIRMGASVVTVSP